MTDIHAILKKYWGYDSFRPLQEDIIASVLSGHDTLGLLPTGGGKSITFQVPAIALGGLCIVVTPLISLMKDQIDHLIERGVKAASVFMGMSHQEVLETYERVIAQNYQFLYLSPERLETQLFLAKLQYMDVRLLVVDEAHCISQWGYDFRPPYLRISDFRKHLPAHVPCLAVTATATLAVIDDIRQKLSFGKDAKVFRASFERPNLTYNVMHVEDKLSKMLDLINEVVTSEEGGGAIVYVRSRKRTREIAESLVREGVKASYYHAGLNSSDKQKRQDDWISGEVPVIVATNAFGMGIDKPNVRLVIHLDLPPSPEEYFQEAGRAGRDLRPATAWILCEKRDRLNLVQHLADEYPERDFIRTIYQKLASFFQISIGAGCNSLFEFDLLRFCTAYKLAISPTYYALRLLDQAGYIIYNEEPDRHSRLMFTTSREALYHLNKFDKDSQKVIQAILRLYTGVFADYVFIREEDLMSRTGMDRDALYQQLLLLSRFHILHYVPARQSPAIVYLTPRLDTDEIRISHTIYEDRKARQEARIHAMLSYVENDQECRLVQLLRYFGETLDHPCGTCDVCRSQQHGTQGNIDELRDFIRQDILSLLHFHTSLPLPHLIDKVHHSDRELVAEIARTMLESHEIQIKDGLVTSVISNKNQ